MTNPTTTNPTTSVIIPNWNGAHLLPSCLDALAAQTLQPTETVVVDNGSTDESRALLAERYPAVRVIPLATNRLFAGGVNAGIRGSSGEVIVLLNNDATPEPDWLRSLIEALERHPEAGMAASKLLLHDRPSFFHSAGDFYGKDGVPGNRGVWEEDRGQYDREEPVFSPCAAAAAYRRSMLDTIGLLDEDLGAYCEDVDLAFRAQLAGYRCVYAPQARVYHRLSATGGGPFASYYCGRNFLHVAAKNLPLPLLQKHLWRILTSQAGFVLASLLHLKEPAARARLRGQWDGLRSLPQAWAKRPQVLALQRVSTDYLESILGT